MPTPRTHNLQDTLHKIDLTFCGAPPSRLLIDQPAQLAQQIDTEEGAPCAHRHYWVGRANIRPFDRQRAQPPLRVQI